MNKILVIRLSSIGDILLATPLLRALRKRFPNAQIDFVTKSQFVDLVKTNPHLDTIWTLDTRKGRQALVELKGQLRSESYDLVVDIHNNFRSTCLRNLPNARVVKVRKYKFKRFLLVKFGLNLYKVITPVYKRYIDTVARFGVKDDGLGLDFFPLAEIKQQVESDLVEHGFDPKTPAIALAPGAGFATKRWPVDYYAELAKMLVQYHNAQILLFGNEKEIGISKAIQTAVENKTINLTGKYSLMQSASALDVADLVIANDTGLMHLATALKKPTVAIFGPTTQELGFFPVGENVSVVENVGLPCRPCTHIGRHTCPKGHFKCMLDISPNQVYRAVRALLPKSLLEKEL